MRIQFKKTLFAMLKKPPIDEKESFVFLSVESQYARSLQASTGLPVRATGL